MTFFSRSRRVDRLWVGIPKISNPSLISRVDEALRLIERYDARRYERIQNDVKKIWVIKLLGAFGQYNRSLKLCMLDVDFVSSSNATGIALVIVHEATHARLMKLSIGYTQDLRYRVERTCMRQELAFARRLHDNEAECQAAHRLEAFGPSFWSDKALAAHHLQIAIVEARRIGLPELFIKAFSALVRRRWGMT